MKEKFGKNFSGKSFFGSISFSEKLFPKIFKEKIRTIDFSQQNKFFDFFWIEKKFWEKIFKRKIFQKPKKKSHQNLGKTRDLILDCFFWTDFRDPEFFSKISNFYKQKVKSKTWDKIKILA